MPGSSETGAVDLRVEDSVRALRDLVRRELIESSPAASASKSLRGRQTSSTESLGETLLQGFR
jgi:hypothetical protein